MKVEKIKANKNELTDIDLIRADIDHKKASKKYQYKSKDLNMGVFEVGDKIILSVAFLAPNYSKVGDGVSDLQVIIDNFIEPYMVGSIVDIGYGDSPYTMEEYKSELAFTFEELVTVIKRMVKV